MNRRSAHPRRLLPLFVGLAAVLALGGPTGLAAGAGAWWLSRRLLRADPDRAERREAERLAPQWTWTLDLIAAGMRAGAPFPQAAFAAAADGGPIGERLTRFARSVDLGATATESAPELGLLPGVERMARQLDRSAASGAAIAGGLEQLAASLREEDRNRAEERSARAAVAMVGPLCACFLPAFVVAGIGPVVFGIVADTMAAA